MAFSSLAGNLRLDAFLIWYWHMTHDIEICRFFHENSWYLRRGERKPALIMKTPAHSKLPALKSSSCSVALTAQKVLRQTSWNSSGGLRVLSPSSNIFFSIYLFNWRETGLRGIDTYCSRFLAHNTFKIGVPLLEQTRKHHDWEH